MPARKLRRKWDGKDISPVGWYVASFLLRIEAVGAYSRNPNRRCRAWENTILVKASNPEEAYKKVVAWGRMSARGISTDESGRKVRHTFEGLTSLLPVYDDISFDCCEIIWEDHKNKAVKTIQSWVLPKKELEVFERYYKQKPKRKDGR